MVSTITYLGQKGWCDQISKKPTSAAVRASRARKRPQSGTAWPWCLPAECAGAGAGAAWVFMRELESRRRPRPLVAALHEVHDREEHDPDQVDEVPVQAGQ